MRHNCLAAHIFDRRVLSLGDYAFRAWDPCAKMCSAHALDSFSFEELYQRALACPWTLPCEPFQI